MPVQTFTVLKSYFETGDTPTEAQYKDVFDTIAFHDQEALTAAANAEAVAAAANVRAPSCMINYKEGLFVTAATFNVASLISIDSNRFRVNFTTVIPSPYVVLITPYVLSSSFRVFPLVLVIEPDHCEFRFLNENSGTSLPGFSLIIYEIP